MSGFLASSAFATFPGANGRIAFTGQYLPGCSGAQPPHYAICTVRPDGRELMQLNSFGHDPSWSANGRRIVFLTGKAIYTMKADGSDRTRIARTTGVQSAAFSPSGGRIVYVRYHPKAPPRRTGAIYTIRADGSRKRLIFASEDLSETPTYSPNGGRIVFAGKPTHRSWGIWTIRPDGTRPRPITTNPNRYRAGSDHYPDWSPDGSQIEFVRYNDCDERFCSGPIKFVRPDGSGLHGNDEISVPGNDESGTQRFRYAPSGDLLVSWVYESPEGIPYLPQCSNIFTVPVVGGGRTSVTHNCDNYPNGPIGFASDPSWQPLPGG